MKKESEDERETKERKKPVDRFVFLHDDILLNILERVPDAVLRYKAKYVCRRWLEIITKRILLDTASFILQNRANLTARYVGIREEGEGLQVKVMDLDMPRIGMIRSWGNEFLLISDNKKERKSLYVYNLITKEGSYLPECGTPCGKHNTCKCGVALSFDVFKGIYKVVHLFMETSIECHILILSKDIVSSTWKKIQLPCTDDWRWFFCEPVSVQGRYLHWDSFTDRRMLSMDLFSMNMEKEEIVPMNQPLSVDHGGFRYSTFEMSGSLALYVRDPSNKAEIWILKDFHRKKWEKLQSNTLENCNFKEYHVYGVMSKRYIILKRKYNRGVYYYDLKNGVFKKLDIRTDVPYDCYVYQSPLSF